MGAIYELWKFDPRVEQEFAVLFQGQVHLVEYLVRMMRTHRGSRETASLIAQSLSRVAPQSLCVQEQDVRRFALEEDETVVIALSGVVSGLVPHFLRLVVQLVHRLKYRVCLDESYALEDAVLFRRVCVDQENIPIYIHIFTCASAMMRADDVRNRLLDMA